MSATDRGGVGPRALVTGGPGIAVEDDALWPPALHGASDLLVVGDGHVLVASLVEELAHDLAKSRLVLDEQHTRFSQWLSRWIVRRCQFLWCGHHASNQPFSQLGAPVTGWSRRGAGAVYSELFAASPTLFVFGHRVGPDHAAFRAYPLAPDAPLSRCRPVGTPPCMSANGGSSIRRSRRRCARSVARTAP